MVWMYSRSDSPFHDQAIRTDEERLINLVTESTLERKQTIGRGIENLGDDLASLVRSSDSFVRVWLDAQVLDNADAFKMHGVDHKR